MGLSKWSDVMGMGEEVLLGHLHFLSDNYFDHDEELKERWSGLTEKDFRDNNVSIDEFTKHPRIYINKSPGGKQLCRGRLVIYLNLMKDEVE